MTNGNGQPNKHGNRHPPPWNPDAPPMKRREPLDVDREPWERQSRESLKAYQAFLAYLELGVVRTQKKAAEQVGKTRDHVHNWASRFQWAARVDAWDRNVEAERRARAMERQTMLGDTIAVIAGQILTKVAGRIAAMDQDEVSRLAVSDVIRMYGESVRAVKAVYGDKSEVEVNVSGSVDVNVAARARAELGSAIGRLANRLAPHGGGAPGSGNGSAVGADA